MLSPKQRIMIRRVFELSGKTARDIMLPIGAVVVATGYDMWDPKPYEEYGVGRYKDIITSLEFERMVSSNGPTIGVPVRPSDVKVPKNVVFIKLPFGARDRAPSALELGVPAKSSQSLSQSKSPFRVGGRAASRLGTRAFIPGEARGFFRTAWISSAPCSGRRRPCTPMTIRPSPTKR